MPIIRKLSLSLVIFAFVVWPTFTMAQTPPAEAEGPPTAAEAAATEQKGACPDGEAQGGAAQGGTGQGCPEKKRQNAAEQINVKLQVPLPFVPMTCKDKEGNPAVCKLTDYIAGMYRLLVGLGALFAVVMVIMAGYQWIFAGGSADKIGAAKKRIMGAFIGLILALLSYVILNSISARLVELRLPLVDPVPAIYWAGGEACYNSDEKSDNKELAKMEAKNNPPIPRGKLNVLLQTSDPEAPAVTSRDATVCGQKYTIEGVGECSGTRCLDANSIETGEACVDNKCQRIFLYGNIINAIDISDFGQAATGGRRVTKLEAYQVCGFVPNMIDTKDVYSSASKYALTVRPLEAGRPDLNIDKSCVVGNKGYVLIVSAHRFIGEDDRYYIGKDCKYLRSESGAAWFDTTYLGNVDPGLLWQKADFTGQAQRCDLDLTNMSQFPKITD